MIDELSIIIPTLNEERYLPRLLDSLATQTFVGKTEVIVVDGESRDDTVRVAKGYRHRLTALTVLSTSKNVGHQRNGGAAAAKYRYLLFLDADVVLPPDLIRQVCEKVDGSHAFVVAVNHTGEHVTIFDRAFLAAGVALISVARWLGKPAVIGDFLMTTKSAHEQIGGFVEGALLGEDTDYGRRLVKAGARYYFFWRLYVIGSDRRVRQMGRAKLLWVWSRGFVHVLRHGPIFPGQGYEYPFGHYDAAKPVAKRRKLR